MRDWVLVIFIFAIHPIIAKSYPIKDYKGRTEHYGFDEIGTGIVSKANSGAIESECKYSKVLYQKDAGAGKNQPHWIIAEGEMDYQRLNCMIFMKKIPTRFPGGDCHSQKSHLPIRLPHGRYGR